MSGSVSIFINREMRHYRITWGEPAIVCQVKEMKCCPRCGADAKYGFDFRFDPTLPLGAACLCECGFRF